MNSTRRDFLVKLAATVPIALNTGCFRAPSKAKAVVGFIDISASVKDYSAYREAWLKILDHLGPGDRVLIGTISDRTLTDFRPLLDCELPKYNYWLDARENYDEATGKVRATLSGAIDKAEKMPRSPKTDIMNAFWLAGEVFAGDPRKPVVMLFSDMMEDSAAANFYVTHLDEATTTRIITQKKRKDELPTLRGAQVYVIGASAAAAERAFEVERFWIRFVKAAGGNLAPENYGPTFLNFDE